MVSHQYSKLFLKSGLAILALAASAHVGNAQNVFQGKFTLPVDAQWQSAKLPAGDYTITLTSTSAPYWIYLRGAKASAIIQAVTTQEGSAAGRFQLDLEDVAGVPTIEAFEAPGLDLTLIYWKHGQKSNAQSEAHRKAVPQTAPATQVSENQTYIEVQAAGR
jgi:hypothetical protein